MSDEEREDLNTFRHELVKQARWWQWKAEVKVYDERSEAEARLAELKGNK